MKWGNCIFMRKYEDRGEKYIDLMTQYVQINVLQLCGKNTF